MPHSDDRTEHHLPADRVEQERELYRRLLALGDESDLSSLLKETLSLIVSVTGAQHVYLELYDQEETAGNQPDRWIAHGCDEQELEAIRSRSVIDEVRTTGESVSSSSVVSDPRFMERLSVQRARPEAVLCVPVGGAPAIGVIYLQGRAEPGPFSDDDREELERVARALMPYADRLLVRARQHESTDATREIRKTLRADDVVGRSPALAHVLTEAALAAPLRDMTVLLTGASGTGKTQLARVIHRNGPRESGPFVELNVATLPTELIESELFGAKKGSHSSATTDIRGKVEAAEHGTLFLDEIGELPRDAQAKLLQLLHSKKYYPLGATEPRTADVRVIAATNVDLEAAVEAGTFRDDLYWRLEVLTIRLPELSERRQDIPEIARALVRSTCDANGLAHRDLSRAAVNALELAEWPGQVRQLQNAIARGCARAAAEGVDLIEPRHLFRGEQSFDEAVPAADTWQEANRAFQRQHLIRILSDSEGNVTEASRRLQVSRSYVHKLMDTHGVDRFGRDRGE